MKSVYSLPTNTEKSDWLSGFQHFPLIEGVHSALGGEHWTKLKMEAKAQNRKQVIMMKYRRPLRQLLVPMIRRIRKATDILPVANAMIAKG